MIALFTEPERNAMFVRHADEAFNLGPRLRRPRRRPSEEPLPRLRGARARAGRRERRRGLGRLGLRRRAPAFVELCERLRIVFVGPDAADAPPRRQDQRQGPRRGGGRPGGSPRAAGRSTSSTSRAQADEIGYPLMVKAAAGGGGRGIRRVDSEISSRPSSPTPRAERWRRSAIRRSCSRADHPGSARRGAGDRRRRGGRGRSACATRLAAAQPEGDRGIGEPGVVGQ